MEIDHNNDANPYALNVSLEKDCVVTIPDDDKGKKIPRIQNKYSENKYLWPFATVRLFGPEAALGA